MLEKLLTMLRKWFHLSVLNGDSVSAHQPIPASEGVSRTEVAAGEGASETPDELAIDVEKEVAEGLRSVSRLEKRILEDAKGRLALRAEGKWHRSDDDLFEGHTAYTVVCWRNLLAIRSTLVWSELLPFIEEADANIRRQGGTPIHRGAPLYNTAISFFYALDFDHAYQYFAEAGLAEERLGRGNAGRLLIGDHALSEQVLLLPIVAWGATLWQRDYAAGTGRTFDLAEVKSLLAWLAAKLADAMHVVISLHRMARLQGGPVNEAISHLQLRALADLVLVVESSLRRWQTVQGELSNRFLSLLAANPNARTSYDDAAQRFRTQWPTAADQSLATAVNWVVDDCLQAFDIAPTVAGKCGISCYLCLRLRNSLMHVIEESLDLYGDRTKLLRVTGLMLVALRASQHGAEGTLAGV